MALRLRNGKWVDSRTDQVRDLPNRFHEIVSSGQPPAAGGMTFTPKQESHYGSIVEGASSFRDLEAAGYRINAIQGGVATGSVKRPSREQVFAKTKKRIIEESAQEAQSIKWPEGTHAAFSVNPQLVTFDKVDNEIIARFRTPEDSKKPEVVRDQSALSIDDDHRNDFSDQEAKRLPIEEEASGEGPVSFYELQMRGLEQAYASAGMSRRARERSII